MTPCYAFLRNFLRIPAHSRHGPPSTGYGKPPDLWRHNVHKCVCVCECEGVCVSVKVCVSVCKTSRSPCIKNTPLGCILSGNGMPISYLIATRGVSYSNIGSIDSTTTTTTTTTATSSRIARSHKSKAAQRAALKLPLRACSRNQSNLDGKVNNALALAVAVPFAFPLAHFPPCKCNAYCSLSAASSS